MFHRRKHLYGYDVGHPMNPYVRKKTLHYTIQSISFTGRTEPIHKNWYRFAERLGKGSFGTVYAGRRLSDGKQVAIKVVSLATTNSRELQGNEQTFRNEVQMAKRLAHVPGHIVPIYDFAFEPYKGVTFIVMERGQQDLGSFLSNRALLSSPERKAIWRQLVNIAMVLHSQQIVHFDIKPSNLIMYPGNLIKLADLGIAQKVHEKIVGSLGSVPYSAPEATQNPVYYTIMANTKVDVWSWGAILYYMTYKQPPNKHYTPPCYHPPPNQYPARDPYLLDVLRRTLVSDPRRRPDTPWLAEHPYTRTI